MAHVLDRALLLSWRYENDGNLLEIPLKKINATFIYIKNDEKLPYDFVTLYTTSLKLFTRFEFHRF